MISGTNVLIFSLAGGLLPALFWLWFWLREDRLKPEPKSAVLSAFLGGIIAVFLALFFELIVYYLLVDANSAQIESFPLAIRNFLENLVVKYDLVNSQKTFWEQVQTFLNNSWLSSLCNFDIKKCSLVIIIAPIIEEVLKLLLTYNICLRRKINDEPIDSSIYMLTAALGFAAIETAIFLAGPLNQGNIIKTVVTGNYRSIGPMIIHLVSSAIIGLFIGLAFYKSKPKKIIYMTLGLTIAIISHAVFNLFISLNDATHDITFFWLACLCAWILVVVLLAFFEKVKKIRATGAKTPRKV